MIFLRKASEDSAKETLEAMRRKHSELKLTPAGQSDRIPRFGSVEARSGK
jgi:hypothetical protein